MLRFALLASALLAFAPSVMADEAKPVRMISISGHGEVRGAPDVAVVNIGVIRSADTAREALTLNNEAMAAIMTALAKAGIEAKDIQTSGFMVNPRYDYNSSGGTPPKTVGYDVVNNVSVTVRKLDSLGAILDEAVSAGSNQINGVMFAISKPEAMQDEARKLAVADAKRKAALYAGETGVTLGKVIALSEGGAYQPPVPVAAKQMAEGSVPIAQGEQALAIDVNITWQID